ncbi:MAG: hypothetical protein K0M46_02335 [Thiobacillus sp.]|nr:hypothetical protein [Thiobacillus sp.]
MVGIGFSLLLMRRQLVYQARRAACSAMPKSIVGTDEGVTDPFGLPLLTSEAPINRFQKVTDQAIE